MRRSTFAILLITGLLATAALADLSTGRIFVKEDEFAGSSTVFIDGLQLQGELEFTAFLSTKIEGKKIEPALLGVFGEMAGVAVKLTSSNNKWRFLQCHTLDWLADGERINSTTRHDGRVGNGHVLEFVDTNIPFRKFACMATASNLRGKLCNTEFEFSPTQIGTLKAFAEQAGIYEAIEAYSRAQKK